MNPQDWQQQQQYDPSQEWPAAEPQQSHFDPTQYDANHYPGQLSPRHYQHLFDEFHHNYEEHRQHDNEHAPHESDEVQPEYEYMPHYSGDVPMMHSSWDPPGGKGGKAAGSEDEDEDEEMGNSYLGHSLRFWQLLAFLGLMATIAVLALACLLVRNKEIKKAIAAVVANNPSLRMENMSYHISKEGLDKNELLVVMDLSLENLATSTFQYIDATSSVYYMYELVGVFSFELPMANAQRFSRMVTYTFNQPIFEDYFSITTVKGSFSVKRMSHKTKGYFTASVNCYMYSNITYECE